MRQPAERFSDRVDAYVRSRPSYPSAVIDLLRSACGLERDSVVADVGSGTGIFTRQLLEAGCRVFAVEPNSGMREAAEKWLERKDRFHSVAGTAENTGLPPGSIDLIAATQAFHWFDRGASKKEFQRILKPRGWVAVTWNERLKGPDQFHAGYERIVRKWGTDYATVDHSLIGNAEMSRFFAPQPLEFKEFANAQSLDWEGLKNRLLSSSFAPNVGSPDCIHMLAELETLFRETAQGGRVLLSYRTVVYYAQLQS